MRILSDLVKPSPHNGGHVEADEESDDSVCYHHVGIELQEHLLGEQLTHIYVNGLSHSLIDIRF